MKDHEIRETVSHVQDLCFQFRDSQQLRERIANFLVPKLKGALAPSDAAQAPIYQARFSHGWLDVDPMDYEDLAGEKRIVYAVPVAPAAAAADLLPNAMWTRHGSGSTEWWSFKGYEARKDSADQWVLRKAGEELYRHTYLQVIMAHAERKILEAAPTPPSTHAAPIPLLAADHKGMRVDYSGVFKHATTALARGGKEPGLAEMLRQMKEHITELGQRWYAGDTAVVDELLQLYCVEKGARDALVAASGAAQ